MKNLFENLLGNQFEIMMRVDETKNKDGLIKRQYFSFYLMLISDCKSINPLHKTLQK